MLLLDILKVESQIMEISHDVFPIRRRDDHASVVIRYLFLGGNRVEAPNLLKGRRILSLLDILPPILLLGILLRNDLDSGLSRLQNRYLTDQAKEVLEVSKNASGRLPNQYRFEGETQGNTYLFARLVVGDTEITTGSDAGLEITLERDPTDCLGNLADSAPKAEDAGSE